MPWVFQNVDSHSKALLSISFQIKDQVGMCCMYELMLPLCKPILSRHICLEIVANCELFREFFKITMKSEFRPRAR